jgi:hypothetical protein
MHKITLYIMHRSLLYNGAADRMIPGVWIFTIKCVEILKWKIKFGYSVPSFFLLLLFGLPRKLNKITSQKGRTSRSIKQRPIKLLWVYVGVCPDVCVKRGGVKKNGTDGRKITEKIYTDSTHPIFFLWCPYILITQQSSPFHQWYRYNNTRLNYMFIYVCVDDSNNTSIDL